MTGRIPFTEKTLKDWAGWRAFRDGKALFARGVVEKVSYEHPFVTGMLNLGPRGMRSRFKVLEGGLVDNLCPCRDNQERGLICPHLVALGMELIRRHADPERAAKAEAEQRRAERLAKIAEEQYVRRVKKNEDGAVAARLALRLAADWPESLATGRVGLFVSIDADGQEIPIGQAPRDVPYAFAHRDENVLFVLEDVANGPVPDRLELSVDDFVNLLNICPGKALHREGRVKGYSVHEERIATALEMDLDRKTGELLLSLNAEFPSGKSPAHPPLYVVGRKQGWVFRDDRFWPLQTTLPRPLHEIYRGAISIPRDAVPAFLMTEMPQLEQVTEVRGTISPDLFEMQPATPKFRLVVKGSPASLAAKLYARYDDRIELVAGRADMRGNFALPDPDDIMSYRIRNMEAEKRAVERLSAVGFVGRAGDTLRNVVGQREVLNFLGSGVPKIRRMGWKVEMEGRVKRFAEEADYLTPVVHIVGSSGDYFEVGYDYEVGTESLSEREIQRAIMMGDSFIEREGRVVLLDADAIRQAREVFDDCAVGPGDRPGTFRMKSIYGSYVQSSLDALDGIDVEAPPDWLEEARRQNVQDRVEPVEPSPRLRATLRSYQQEGLNWLRFLEVRGFCGILADEMGLGKTIQTLAWIQLERVREEARGKPTLIVCPTSLVENWREEAARFAPDLKTTILHGTDRHEKWDDLQSKDLVITSYALMRRDVDRHLACEYAVTILDEAQHIKNRSTRNAVAAKRLRSVHRLVLTGTPIENGVSDLWSIMDFLMPGYLGNHKDFHEFYEQPILGGGSNAEYAQAKLRRKLHPFLLRRLKKDVAKDLPPKIESAKYCKLTADQHKVYTHLLEESKRRISGMVAKDGFNKSRMEILKTLLRLRQTCCHIDLLKLPGLRSEHPSAKMELFFELLNEALDAGHRVLVFSQFTSMLAILRKELEERGLRYCYLDGSTKDRQDVVRRFNKDRDVPVFLMSLKAGGTGLNLTGADMVIHYDPWWNPAVEDQATDRAHRIGQKNTVYSNKLIARGTVEEKVVDMQLRKKGVIDATLATDEQVMQKLTWEDVRELLDL